MRTITQDHFVDHAFRPTTPAGAGKARSSTLTSVMADSIKPSGRTSASSVDASRNTDTVSEREKDLEVQLAAAQVRKRRANNRRWFFTLLGPVATAGTTRQNITLPTALGRNTTGSGPTSSTGSSFAWEFGGTFGPSLVLFRPSFDNTGNLLYYANQAQAELAQDRESRATEQAANLMVSGVLWLILLGVC
jgi:hypothetical protein